MPVREGETKTDKWYSSVQKGTKGGECLARNDWNALRTEYVTTDISLPKMHEKHGTSLSALKDRCAKEGWVAAREEYRAEVGQRVVQKAVNDEVERLEGLQKNASLVSTLIHMNLLNLANAGLDVGVTEEGVKMVKDLTTALKQISEVMKDLYMIPVKKEGEDGSGGVIFLPPVMEEEVAENADDMDTTAEADRVSAEE